MSKAITGIIATVVLSGTVCCAAPQGAYIIVPGHSIGHISLGADGARTLSHLPQPFAHDEGMSQTEQVWVSGAHGHRYTLFIHTASNGALDVKPADGVTIDVIRVTSPVYRTRGGIGPGSTLSRILHYFPGAKSSSSPAILDANAQGIAFEFPKAPKLSTECIAVTVHTPGVSNVPSAAQIAGLLQEAGK